MLKLVETPVVQIMTRPVITVTPNTSAETVKTIFVLK
jgi:CBS domain-containing protein